MTNIIGTRNQVMHRDVRTDFEHFRPGETIVWYHGPSNDRQSGTILNWEPVYTISADGRVICVKAYAVIHCPYIKLVNQPWRENRTVRETFTRYGSGIEAVYR